MDFFPSTGLFYGTGAAGGKLAYLFAGQGAQYLGMGGRLADTFPVARRAWETLGRIRFAGRAVKEMVFPPEGISAEEAKVAFLRLSGSKWTSP